MNWIADVKPMLDGVEKIEIALRRHLFVERANKERLDQLVDSTEKRLNKMDFMSEKYDGLDDECDEHKEAQEQSEELIDCIMEALDNISDLKDSLNDLCALT